VNPRLRAFLRVVVLIAVGVILFRIFPKAFAFTEMAARDLRYFWWLILLVALACWLIWGFKRRP
jgi:uncharacterized protein with PQ loop repeat